jgi:predicted metal-dependent peptidase
MRNQSKDFDLNFHTARLLLEEPFFAAISRRVNKRASFGISTAGVIVNRETAQFEMLYNPDFMDSMTDPERRAILIHEFYHIIFKHVTDRLPEGGMTKAWNIAADLAINSHIANLPKGGCIPGEDQFIDLPPGKAAEWYLPFVERMMQDQSKDSPGEGSEGEQGQRGKSASEGDSDLDTLDDHSGWGDVPQEIKDIANERLKDIVQQATDEASQSGSWGSVSSETRKELIASLKTKVDWRKVLRFFVKASQRANKSSTIRRINRRYPYIHPGRKSDRVANIAISVDQSGSVDNAMLALFFAELNKLSEVASFTVVPFDTKVDEKKVYEWRKGESRPVERVLSGGTCFDAPTKYVNARKFDGHIVLTDMCAPKPIPSKCQRLWMTTQSNADAGWFETKERVVVVD